MKRKTALIVGCLLSLAAPAAYAQSDLKLQLDPGFYVGLGVGRAEAKDFCTSFGGACDAKDVTWNIFAGYQINRYFAVELGYNNFGDATTSGFTGGGAPATLTAETTAIELVGVATVPLTDAFSLYAKAGVYRSDTDLNGTGAAVGAASDKETGGTFGLGAQYNINRNFAARLEWQRYMGVVSNFLGTADGDIAVLRLTTRYKF